MTTAAAVKKRGRPRKMQEDDRLRHSPAPSAVGPRRTLRPRRRRPLLDGFADFDDYLDEEEEEEEEEQVDAEDLEPRGKRRQLKVILKLPPPAPTAATRTGKEEEEDEKGGPRRVRLLSRESSCSASSSSYVDDDEDDKGGEDEVVEPIKPLKKRRFDGCADGARSCRSADRESRQGNLLHRTKGSVSGLPTSSEAARTPLPEKKLLGTILDMIQKKDTYGVFAEPVDIDELPDYFDVIERPMDFGTVRKKLATNAYRFLEQFEDDVFLICSNAMQYNAPDTIYFRQARSMQDIGRREFQKLITESKSVEIDSKCEEKARVNSTDKKSLQKSLPKIMQESFVSDISSATTLASGGDAFTGLSTVEASAAEPATTSTVLADGSSSLGDSKSDQMDEFRVKDSPSKSAKKSLEVDENRRATYNISDYQCEAESGTVYDALEGDQKKLVALGLDAEYSYARSLARFAGNLGPLAWKIASERIRSALPSGIKFGCGWVGEYEPLLSPILAIKNNIQPEHQQTDINRTIQFKMPFKDRTTAMGGKASGNSDSKGVNFGTESQLSTKIQNRDSDTMKGGNHRSGVTGGKQQSFSVISETQLRTDAPVLQKRNRQVSFNLAEASGAAVQPCQQGHLYSSNNRLVNEDSQRPHANGGVSTCISPQVIQLDGKPMQPESLKQMKVMRQCNTTDGKTNVGQLSNWKVTRTIDNNSVVVNGMESVSKYQRGIVNNSAWTIGRHEHGLSDPSKLISLPINIFSQSNISNSSINSSELFPLAVPSNASSKSNADGAVVPQAWMPVRASTLPKLSADVVDVHNSSTGRVSTFSYDSSWRTPNSSPGISDHSKTASMFQAFRQPIQVSGVEPQVCGNGLVIFPQLVATDMSRFQNQTLRQGQLPRTENKHNRNICPPDLNISFQSPGSPVRHTSVILDSQQPDLALQL